MPQRLSQPVRRFFAHFVRDESSGRQPLVSIIAEQGSPPALVTTSVIIDEPPLRISSTRSHLIFELPGISCHATASGAQIWIEDLNLVPVDHFSSWMLVAILFELAIPHGFLGLHAAAFRTGDGAILLPGASGSGKTTIFDQALAQGFEAISDDLVWVRREEAVFRAIPFPRRDRDAYHPISDQPAITALVLPEISQSKHSRMFSLEPSAAIRRLMEQGSFFPGSPSAEVHFRTLIQFGNAVPCFMLEVGTKRDGLEVLCQFLNERNPLRNK